MISTKAQEALNQIRILEKTLPRGVFPLAKTRVLKQLSATDIVAVGLALAEKAAQ